ncbi:MAG: CheR family methyltransferase [Bacteroidota bacterium]
MLPDSILNETSLMVARRLGLDFPQNRWNDLERGILLTARELGLKETIHGISEWLSANYLNSRELEILFTYLTVGETYFFREKPGLDAFQKYIIPEIVRDRIGKEQFLRIWSAGCCTGEEPFTLAILLKEIIPNINKWNITLLATDANTNFLKKAKKGIFSSWSFREIPKSVKNQYFLPAGKNWEVIPEIKKMVTFSSLNLAEDEYPSMLTNTNAMDVIFCRNVLMYFTPEQIKLVGQRFYKSLTDKGWFIPSSVELNDDYFSEFASQSVEKGIFYRKIPKTKVKLTSAVLNHPAPKLPISKKHSILPKSKAKSIQITQAAIFSTENPSSTNEVKTLYEKGLYQQCTEQCILMLSTTPSDIPVLTFLAKSFANMGKLDEARHWGEKLISTDRTGADSYYLYATILVEKNEPETAESTLKRALYLDPHHLLSHFLMGTIANRQGRKQVAVKHFKNVKELLSGMHENEVVPGSEGMTVGRINELIEILL